MHALNRIHQCLRKDGVLLDIHPQPENSRIEIWQEGAVHHLGEIDQSEDNMEIGVARAVLASFVDRSMFRVEDRNHFELLEHHDTVQSWQESWAKQGYRLVAEPELLDSAHDLLTADGGELVIREPVQATLLNRVDANHDEVLQ